MTFDEWIHKEKQNILSIFFAPNRDDKHRLDNDRFSSIDATIPSVKPEAISDEYWRELNKKWKLLKIASIDKTYIIERLEDALRRQGKYKIKLEKVEKEIRSIDYSIFGFTDAIDTLKKEYNKEVA